MSKQRKGQFWDRLMGGVGLLAIGAGIGSVAPPQDAEAAITPNDRTPAQAVDTANTRPYWVGLGIRNEAGNSGGTCTGLLINPRTVLFAAHCVDGVAPAGYDFPTAAGNRAQVGYTTDPTFGRTNLRNWLFGQDFAVPAGDGRTMVNSVFVWYDPRSRFGSAAVPNNGTFLPADIAIAGFATPTELLGRDARDGIGLLFTPVSSLVPITVGGYGASGNGQTGARTSSALEESYFRRLGQNMLGFLGDERTLAVGIYGNAVANITEPASAVYQDLYWADFDDPARASRPFFNGPGNDPLCVSPNFNCRLDHDPFPGDAVANETMTGAGDSGSPLVTNAFTLNGTARDVSLGVLSQGSRFFYESLGNPNDNFVRFTDFGNYGTISGYNPLFLFWDQIVVNNPYKYVTAAGGAREWTDATTWTQEIDPLYFTLSGSTLVNGVPTTPALGMSSATPNVGTIRPSPSPAAACAFTGTCPPTGGTDEPTANGGGANSASPGSQTLSSRVDLIEGGEGDVAPSALEGLITGGSAQAAGGEELAYNAAHATTSDGLPGVANEAMTTAPWSSGTLIGVSTGALTGPGSTNFVPNNTLGTAGLQNSTRWFEVNLRTAGTLSLTGATITIDRLNVRNAGSTLNIRSGARLNTEISSFVDAGVLNVDGVFAPRALNVLGGTVQGNGTITTTGGIGVVGGVITPGTAGGVGTMTINGALGVGQLGVMGIDVASATSADRFNINGALVLNGGGFAMNFANYRPRFNETWTVANATGGITGSFAMVTSANSGLLIPVVSQSGNNLNVRMDALAFSSFVNPNSVVQTSFGAALDSLRRSSNFAAVSGLFNEIDVLTPAQAQGFLELLAPNDSLAGADLLRNSGPLLGEVLQQRAAARMAGGMGGGGAFSALSDQAGLGSRSSIAAMDSGTAERTGRYVFADVRTVNGETDLSSSAGRTEFDAIAYTFGAEFSAGGPGLTLGGAAQFITGETGQALGAARSENEGYQVGAFAEFATANGFAISGYAGFGNTDLTLKRAAGAFNLEGSTSAATTSVGVSIGKVFDLGPINFAPRIGFDRLVNDIDGYTETGGAAALIVPDRKVTTSLGRISGTLFGSFQGVGGKSMFSPRVTIGYVNELEQDVDAVIGATFAAAPGVQINGLPGDTPDGDWFDAKVGLDVALSERAVLTASYSTSLERDDADVTSAQIGLRLSW